MRPPASLLLLLLAVSARAADVAPLPPGPDDTPEIELGRALFFDYRLSGDATTSCSYCHSPENAYTDALPLSDGYPSTLNFRNTPSLFNSDLKPLLYWDGRFPGDDMASLIRDHLSEPNLMNADGRLIVERLRHIPYYAERFSAVYGREPSYGDLLSALAAFTRSIRSSGSPFERYLRGEAGAMTAKEKRGYELFRGEAGCVKCHGGPLLSDGKLHARGVPENPEVMRDPRRNLVFRRFFKTFGVEGYRALREDVGAFAQTKKPADKKAFVTPSLWEVARTPPYMHNGLFDTLEDAIAFEAPDSTPAEREELTAFLEALSSPQAEPPPPEIAPYAPRKLDHSSWKPSVAEEKAPDVAPELGPLPPVKHPADNPATPEKIALGRMLFFDTRISGNRENSCSTCHNPSMGWGDGYDISQGYLGTQHWRNSQTLLYAGHYSKLHWDGSKASLEEQAKGVIDSAVSANGEASLIEERLAQAPTYYALFTQVFGKDRPHYEDMIKAISAYIREAAATTDVPFDTYARGERAALSESAVRGLALFKGEAGCVRCHNGPLFSDENFHSTGVPDNPVLQTDHLKQITLRYKLAAAGVPRSYYETLGRDPGLFAVTKRPEDIAKFRTPSLRELKHTAPYMHNGVFRTLREVIDFYDEGGGPAPNKTSLLRPLRLADSDKDALISFLEALSGVLPLEEAPELPGYPGSEHK